MTRTPTLKCSVSWTNFGLEVKHIKSWFCKDREFATSIEFPDISNNFVKCFFKLVKILLTWCGWDSTMFLLGPTKQLRTMCDPERWFACTIYFCSLFFTLFSALKVKPKLPSYYIKLILSTNGVVQKLLLCKLLQMCFD